MGLMARIKWHFKPTDYFEEPFSTEFDGILIEIIEGEIVAQMDLGQYERGPEIRESLASHIEGLFEGARLWSHEDFEISRGAVEKDRPEGGRDLVISPEPGRIKISGKPVDIRITDADGNVVADTRQDRVAAKKRHAELIASTRGSDETMDAMMESYANAVKDPSDELVHLYEIREALKAHYGDDESAIRTIEISKRKWSTLGRLANREPLNQGRHRGRSNSELRDATAGELENARLIAREMIVLYQKQIS